MIKSLKNKKKKGFTLIELIIVIAIIAILAAIAIPKFATIRHNANVTTDIANAKNIHSVVAQKLANETDKTVIYDGASNINVDTTTAISGALDAGGTKSKVTNGVFSVTISSDGNITVYALNSSGADAKQVYPNPDSSIFNKK